MDRHGLDIGRVDTFSEKDQHECSVTMEHGYFYLMSCMCLYAVLLLMRGAVIPRDSSARSCSDDPTNLPRKEGVMP